MTPRGFTAALLGAESTGKTQLSEALRDALAAEGRDAVVVAEYLREFCMREGRTPRRNEQQGIAAEQTLRIARAASRHDIVLADTTALMIAVYSDQIFDDSSLYAEAESAQRRCHATLLTALDLPWRADGLQRDGPHVREPVDARVRAALRRSGVAFSVVSGSGAERLSNALIVLRRALDPPADDARSPRWRWTCERCGDAACELHLGLSSQRPTV